MINTKRLLAILALAAGITGTALAQTITGTQAQQSPQAEAFLAYERALIAGGLEAAKPHMTPEKLEELNGMKKAFGEEGFQQFLGRMRGGAQGDARRKQIQKIEVKGDHAVLEARDGPNVLTEQHLAKTKDGWKVTVRK